MKKSAASILLIALLVFRAPFSLAEKERDSDNPHYRRGLELFNKGDYAEAENELGQAAKTVKNAHLWTALGNARRENKNWEQALQAYKKAIEIDGNYAPAYAQLGYTCQGLGQLENAKAFYRKALEIDKDYLTGKVLYGWFLLDQGDKKNAGPLFDGVLQKQPFMREALAGKGKTLWAEGKLNDARVYYRKALALGYKDEEIEAVLREDALNR